MTSLYFMRECVFEENDSNTTITEGWEVDL